MKKGSSRKLGWKVRSKEERLNSLEKRFKGDVENPKKKEEKTEKTSSEQGRTEKNMDVEEETANRLSRSGASFLNVSMCLG